MRLVLLILLSTSPALLAQLPPEPLAVKSGEPCLVHDSWAVDNHWPLRSRNEGITLVCHPLKKHPGSPLKVFAADQPSYAWVIRDTRDDGEAIFRMYYQANIRIPDTKGKGHYRTDVCYAESVDGINWVRPDLCLFPAKAQVGRPNNVVVAWDERKNPGGSAPVILENLPEKDRRGYRIIMLYRGKGAGDIAGLRLVGSEDGVRFDMENEHRIAHLHSDCPNSIIYDPELQRYQLFCRAKQMYRASRGEMIDTGASRRIATLFSSDLWGDWMEEGDPRTLLVPDSRDGDHRYFYGMPAVYRHGLSWGFLEVFRLNDFIHTELVTSRDGIHWFRHPDRPKLIEYGPEGSWDDTMIFASPSWVEVGNKWMFYYAGWDGPHGTPERDGSIGIATCLRERIYSRRGSEYGGVVCTRTIRWPGGELWLNLGSVSGDGENGGSAATVRISDVRRRVMPGYDHGESRLVDGEDATRVVVRWGEEGSDRSLKSLRGEVVRIEVMLRNMDWFSFGATADGASR